MRQRWTELLSELQRVCVLRSDLDLVTRVTKHIENSGGKKWASLIRQFSADGNGNAVIPADALEAWQHRRLESYLRSIDGRRQLSDLSKQQAERKRRLDRAMIEVIQLRTFIGLHNRMQQGGRLSALTRFMHCHSTNWRWYWSPCWTL